jgi:threonine/homoserine/homoserine lactone efflux protein
VRTVAEFAVTAGLLTLIPGPDTLLAVRTAVSAGRAQAVAATAGICTALLGWGCAAGLGLTALLAASPALYQALRWAGVAYLAWLGLRAMTGRARLPGGDGTGRDGDGASRPGDGAGRDGDGAGRPGDGAGRPGDGAGRDEDGAGRPRAQPVSRRQIGGCYLRGVLTCASNPKVGVFYLALFPQFMPPGGHVLADSVLLAGIHAAETLAWLTVVAALAGRLGALLRRRAARRWAGPVFGAAFLAFAARLAVGG